MSSVRKGKVLKMLLAVLSTAIVFCSAAFVSAPAVYAEGDYASVGDRYFHTDTAGATVESFLNKTAVMQPTYKGLRTEITVPEGTENVKATFNALVNPLAKSIIHFDLATPRVADANAIVVTLTSIDDASKQFSLVSVNRKEANGDERCWVTVSLTDDLYFENGFTYITGTKQAPVGLRDTGAYDVNGHTLWSYQGESQAFKYGAIFGGEYQVFITESGDVKINDGTVIANILNPDYLAAGKANLAGSKYEERYTVEYAEQIVAAMQSGCAVMDIQYYDLQTTTVSTHIRGINGQWLGDVGNLMRCRQPIRFMSVKIIR